MALGVRYSKSKSSGEDARTTRGLASTLGSIKQKHTPDDMSQDQVSNTTRLEIMMVIIAQSSGFLSNMPFEYI